MRHTEGVSARSAVFDLYGDHLAEYQYRAPIATVVALLEAIGISASATRTAVSRLVDEGWLDAQDVNGARGYQATSVARQRLDQAGRRIYRRQTPPWDGVWHLTHLDTQAELSRRDRDRLAAQLGYLGLGRLDTRTWIAPRQIPELAQVVHREGLRHRQFHAEQVDGSSGADLAGQIWDLESIDRAYREFLERHQPILAAGSMPAGGGPPESKISGECYRIRAALVHEWRKFLFLDPDLPAQVLPPDWVGDQARIAFLRAADALRPAARIFVQDTMTSRGGADGFE